MGIWESTYLSVTKQALELRHLDASSRTLFAVRKSVGGNLQIL